MSVLRRFPTEIESDLSLLHGFDIADWWQGKKSSRWVWTRIQHLPERSATEKAKREGDWSQDQYVAARIANTLTYFRADHAAVHGEKMSVEPLESPRQQRERAERDAYRREMGSMLRAQLRGEYMPPPRAVTFETTDLTPTLGGDDG